MFEKYLFISENDKNKFENEVFFQSTVRLKSENEASAILCGKKKANFNVPDNFIFTAESNLKKVKASDVEMNNYYLKCALRKMGFVGKYGSRSHTEELFAVKKRIFWKKVWFSSSLFGAIGLLAGIGYQFSGLRNNSKRYLYFLFFYLAASVFYLSAINCMFKR